MMWQLGHALVMKVYFCPKMCQEEMILVLSFMMRNFLHQMLLLVLDRYGALHVTHVYMLPFCLKEPCFFKQLFVVPIKSSKIVNSGNRCCSC